MAKIKNNLMVVLLKLTGIITGVALTTWTTYTQLLKEQPSEVQFSLFGVFVLGIVAVLYLRYFKKKIDHKLQAIAVADELGMVGRTNTFLRAMLNFVYLIYPLIVLYVFAIGVENYQGNALSTNIFYLMVSIGVGSGIFSSGIALDRHFTTNEAKLKQQTFVDDVAKKTVQYIRKV